MCLQINNLQYRYPRGKNYILNGLNLELNPGECIAITGENGSGKSTLISVLAGLADAFQKGELKGEILRASEKSSRPACVLQEPDAQILCDRVSDELAFFMKYSSQSGSSPSLQEAMDGFGIRGIENRRIFQLSYGEKQRLILAGGIICGDQELILLDEPTAHLDQAGVESLLNILGQRKLSGSAIIIIGHDIQRMAGLIDRIYFLQSGKLFPHFFPGAASSFYRKLPRVNNKKTTSILSVSRLAYRNSEGKAIFSDFNREFHRGLVYGIFGPNGVGKTTLARVLAGIYGCSEGEITCQGKKIDRRARQSLVKMVNQNPFHQLLYRTGRRNLQAGLRNRSAETVISLEEGVEILGLTGLLDREVATLSIGEAQRIALLSAILHGPEILIIDESLASLDQEGVNAVRDLIFLLREKDKCIILISHLEKFIKLFCDIQIPLNDPKICSTDKG